MFIAFWRTLALYWVIVFGVRLMGKRQLGQLQPSELVVTILISNIATVPIENTGIPLVNGIVPILLLVCLEVLASGVNLISPAARRLFSGRPRVIIRDGKIDQHQLQQLRYSLDDLTEQLRIGGIFDLDEVGYAIVETTGQLSVYKKFSARQPDNAQLGNTSPIQDHPPLLIINDGRVIPQALQQLNLTEQWLHTQLQKNGCTPQEVFLMSCDRQAHYHLVRKEAAR